MERPLGTRDPREIRGYEAADRRYSVFTSGAYRAIAPNAAFPQEKPHFAALSCSE